MESANSNTQRVTLADLIKLDGSAISVLHSELIRTGWCLVELDNGFSKSMKKFCNSVVQFFDSSEEKKKQYEYSKNNGYVSNNFKNAFRWLSGPFLESSETPEEFSSQISNISLFFDSFFQKLISAVSNLFFEMSADQLGQEYKIPLLLQENLKNKANTAGYGMFDVVKYTSGEINREFMVEEHYDPGIFSLSVYSNALGLELFDFEKNEWIKIPANSNIGVLWTGVAAMEASKGTIKGGFHRVLQHVEYPRVTMWYEVCTKEQSLKENLELGMKRKSQKISLSNLSSTSTSSTNIPTISNEETITIIVETYTGGKLNFDVKPSSTIAELKFQIEVKTGRAFSKTILKPVQLTYNGKSLKNEKLIKDYNFNDGQVLQFMKLEDNIANFPNTLSLLNK